MRIERLFDPVAADARLYAWDVDATAGFDSAWVSLDRGRLVADGWICATRPVPYWAAYRLETTDDFVTRTLTVATRSPDGPGRIELKREGRHWTLDGELRDDLDAALDCDLAGCPLTNTMPILRHELHRGPGAHDLEMAFVELPGLRVVPAGQRYEHVRLLAGGRSLVRYSSAGFEADLVIDGDGFVVGYPKLGARRREPSA